MATYAELDEDAQVAALTPVAAAGAARLGLPAGELELALHGYNTTFRLRGADGVEHAVRVLTNSQSTPPQLEAQHAWMHAIRRETSVLVPDPVIGADGASYAVVPGGALGRPAVVVAASWLAGPDVGTVGVEQAHELGVAMATLHEHAAGWALPPGTAMPTFDAPLFGDPDLLSTLTLPDADTAVLRESFTRAEGAFEAAGDATHPIHGDLHGGNLKWHEGRLAVFDFDDSGLGTPALDLAISTFYLREPGGEAEAGLRDGYQAIRPLPDLDPDAFEALVASRQLLLANALLATSTASLRAEAQSYLQTSLARLRQWLTTGRFTRQLPD